MAKRKKIKEEDLHKVEPGSLLEIDRGYFAHWGVYMGSGEICHFGNFRKAGCSGLRGGEGSVCIDGFSLLVGGCPVYVNNLNDRRWPLIVKAAKYMSEEYGRGKVKLPYDLVTYNCEHFVNFCRYGVDKSDQVDCAATVAKVASM